MLDEPARILVAAALCWINFVAIDVFFRLPESGGVCGATAIAQEVEKGGGNLHGGYMLGNIVSSPDYSSVSTSARMRSGSGVDLPVAGLNQTTLAAPSA